MTPNGGINLTLNIRSQKLLSVHFSVGELEALLSHKDYEMEQQANRIKQIESILAT